MEDKSSENWDKCEKEIEPEEEIKIKQKLPKLCLNELKDYSQEKLGGYDFYHKVLKSPKYVIAPMVDASELTFRMLCRKYSAQLGYTPMLHSLQFVQSKKYREKYFTTCKEDRPLVVQFCGNDPNIVLQAAKMVEDQCDAVDLNLGCPQRIAKKGHYGAFLMEEQDLIFNIVNTLHKYLKVPVFCKIRIFQNFEQTLEYALMLQRAGCQLLTIHGRTREMKGDKQGLADWNVIKKLKEHLSIPVFANGNIQKFEDIERCMEFTKVDGVMSAVGLLENPALFSAQVLEPFSLAYEYLSFAEIYNPDPVMCKTHIAKILMKYLDGDFYENRTKLKNAFFQAYGSWSVIRKAVENFELFIKSDENGRANFFVNTPEKKKLKEKKDQDSLDIVNYANELFFNN